MNVFKRISGWLGISPPKRKESITKLRDLLELGRQARYSENYDNALAIFENVAVLAESQQDSTSLAIARLNIADTLIHMEDYASAEDLLIDLEDDLEQRQHYTPLAYTLCLTGYMHQSQENWELARTYYNRALVTAEKINAEGAIGRAKGHLSDTYLHEGNATYAEYLLKEALPLLDKTDDIELTSHFIGQYALTMLELGRETDGDRLLETALSRAQRLNYISQVRHWNHVLATRKHEKMDYAGAFQHYHDFLKLAPDPLPVNELYGLALSNLSEISRRLGQQSESLDYAQQAEKILSQLESVSLSSQALLSIGIAMRINQRYDEAISYLQRALDAPHDDEMQSTIQLEIAQTHASAGQIEKAQEHYQTLIDTLEKTSEQTAIAHTGLGNVYQQAGKLEKAIQEWMKAHKIYERQSIHDQAARLICDIAQARYTLGDGKRALVDYERALMLLNSVDRQTRGIVLANAAIAYADKGDVRTTEAFFSEAIDIAHELENPTAEAMRRNNYALYLVDIGQAQRAVISIEHAQKLLQNDDNPLYQAIFIDHLGCALSALDKPDEALINHLLAKKFFDDLTASDWVILNKLYLTETYITLGEVEDAEYYLPNYEDSNIDVAIQYHLTSARFYLALKKLNQAQNHIEQAVQKAQQSYRQRQLAKALILQSQIQATSDDKDTANITWQSAEKLLNMLQMPIPNPNWLHVPSSD